MTPQTDLDALDRMVAEAEAEPILWASRAAFLWNSYPALAAELREARKEIVELRAKCNRYSGGLAAIYWKAIPLGLDRGDQEITNIAKEALHGNTEQRAAELEAAATEGEGNV